MRVAFLVGLPGSLPFRRCTENERGIEVKSEVAEEIVMKCTPRKDDLSGELLHPELWLVEKC